MISTAMEIERETGCAFDSLARDYDEVFTHSNIGRAQRDVVWKHANKVFSAGDRILELNCGTGEDALHFAQSGISVTACDASVQMIEWAKRRQQMEGPKSSIQFRVLPTEQIWTLQVDSPFDGAFSNFSGLNCVENLSTVARDLSNCVKNGAPLLLCLSTRVCLWEIAYFLWKGNFKKAFRRCAGQADARLGDVVFTVQYPTVAELRALFAPNFRIRSYHGVGVSVPPSYLEPWARKHPRFLRFLQHVDDIISGWPGFRVIGDHMLLHLERVQ